MTVNRIPTFVLVHGSFGNSFSWAPLQRELALLGHRTLAVDLPGHGFDGTFPAAYQAPQDLAKLATEPSSAAGVTGTHTIEYLNGIVRRAAAHGPVVLVGHSRGGLAITGTGNAIPESIHRLVYISAWCCVGKSPAEYVRTPEHSASALDGIEPVADPARLGAVRMNWRTADPAVLSALKAALLADGTDDEFMAFLNTLQPDEVTGPADERVQADTWGRIPRTYVRLTRDRSLPLALQDLFIREADALVPDNRFDVGSLESSHVGFLLHPAEAAALLAGLADS
ncbi:MAG TPA: alpha/beta hydrolase family protein [Amycolatopsis sp.]|nr:alpha/beta hydrolase family protein [Amycolatopsis sp.]